MEQLRAALHPDMLDYMEAEMRGRDIPVLHEVAVHETHQFYIGQVVRIGTRPPWYVRAFRWIFRRPPGFVQVKIVQIDDPSSTIVFGPPERHRGGSSGSR